MLNVLATSKITVMNVNFLPAENSRTSESAVRDVRDRIFIKCQQCTLD